MPTAAEIRLDGRTVALLTPAAARRAGVAVIHQEFALVPALTAAENIFLGREDTRWGLVRRGDERRRAAELLARVGIPVDPDAPCRDLSVAQQQAVEVAKALAADARVLVMDEPTATLTPPDVAKLFAVVRGLSFTIRRGEVLGLAGLVGAGRTEVARLIAGADRRDTGTVALDGRPLAVRSPRDAARAGIGFLTEDRKGQGLVLAHSVRENFAL